MQRTLWMLFLVALLLAGCDLFGTNDDDPVDTIEGVVVANGGNFSDQNGFVTIYDPATQQTANLPDLGAFAQSMALRDNRAYVALNTFSTGRIDVLDLETNQRVGQINDVPTPRYVAFVDDAKAYVTSLVFGGNGMVSVIDLTTNTLVGDPIEVGVSPESIVVLGNRAYVANFGASGDGTTLSVIDTGADQVVGSIELGCDGPKQLFADDDELVIACQGKTVYNDDFTEIIEQTNGQVVFVDARTDAVIDRIAFDRQVASSNGTQVAYFAPGADELYVIDGATRIFRIDTGTHTLAAEMTVPDQADLTGLTAVAYDAEAQQLYLGRLAQGTAGPDFTAAGAVVILDRAGTQVGRFTAGPAPAHIELRE